MFRWFWILVAVCCTALAQVQPVAWESPVRQKDCCGEQCGCGSACPMNATLPAPAPTAAVATAARPIAAVARVTKAQPVRVQVVRLSAPDIFRATSSHPLRAELALMTAQPLFVRHCVWRI